MEANESKGMLIDPHSSLITHTGFFQYGQRHLLHLILFEERNSGAFVNILVRLVFHTQCLICIVQSYANWEGIAVFS